MSVGIYPYDVFSLLSPGVSTSSHVDGSPEEGLVRQGMYAEGVTGNAPGGFARGLLALLGWHR